MFLSKEISSVVQDENQIAKYLYIRYNDGYYTSIWGDSTSWEWGRWVFFVIFVVFLLALLFFIVKVNKRRRIVGQTPIRGTAWMTLPSYRQSERQYTGNPGGVVEECVPKYTQTANEEDLGYYDERGEFHVNDKSEYLPPPPLVAGLDPGTSNSPERPHRAVTRELAPAMGSGLELDFRRYTYLDNNTTNNSSMQQQQTAENRTNTVATHVNETPDANFNNSNNNR